MPAGPQSPASLPCPTTDRLSLARAVAIALVCAGLGGLVAPLAISPLFKGAVHGPAPGLIRALRLSGPAIVPAGTRARQPETVPPGVDLHASPGLCPFPLDDAALLLPEPFSPAPSRPPRAGDGPGS